MTDEQSARLKILLAYIKNADKFETPLSGMDTVMCTQIAGRVVFDGKPLTKADFDAFEEWNNFDLDEAIDEETATQN